MIVILFIVLIFVLGIYASIHASTDHWSESNAQLNPDAKIISLETRPYDRHKLRTVVRFSDGFEYQSFETHKEAKIWGRELSVSPEMKRKIIGDAIQKHNEILREKVSSGALPESFLPRNIQGDDNRENQAIEPGVIICPLCKTKQRNERQRCYKCGTCFTNNSPQGDLLYKEKTMNDGDDKGNNQREKISVDPIATNESNMILCPICKTKQRADRNLCYKCGTSFLHNQK